jgi:hypothetical protein
MRLARSFAVPAVVLLLALACSSPDSGSSDTPDAGPGLDATHDAQEALDAPQTPDVANDAAPPPDASPDASPDATTPLPGFGALSGACGVLDEAAWADPAPRFVVNHLDFGADPFDDADVDLLTPGGQKIFDDDNAGGSSKMSEIFAFEVLARCELAELLKTEMEVDYLDEQGKITDLLVQVDGRKLGVSVTRAMAWPYDAEYTLEKAAELLEKKLAGIAASTANVAPADAWVRQALSVLAFGDAHAEALNQAWDALPAGTRGDTWLIVTVSDGEDLFLY